MFRGFFGIQSLTAFAEKESRSISKGVIFSASTSRLFNRILFAGLLELCEHYLVGINAQLSSQKEAVGQHVRKLLTHAVRVSISAPLKALEQFARFNRDALCEVLRRVKLIPVPLGDESSKRIFDGLVNHRANVAREHFSEKKVALTQSLTPRKGVAQSPPGVKLACNIDMKPDRDSRHARWSELMTPLTPGSQNTCQNERNNIRLASEVCMSARTIHPFPARMAPDIALDAIPKRDGRTLTVLDPMCGSGTVLAAALERGHHAIGVDIDPLAVMMSTLAVTKIDTTALANRAELVVQHARKVAGRAPWGTDVETDTFADYWFGAAQRQQLIDITTAISDNTNGDLKLALQLAISRIIVTKSSQASLAQDTSHSRPHRVREESEYDVFAGFERSVRQLVRMLSNRPLNGSGRVDLGDARDLQTVVDRSVDLAVTSPPYLNALDYMRGHKLALVWFGHRIRDLRTRRSTSIGAERALGQNPSAVVGAIVDVIESEAIDPAALRRPMLERFAHDCVGFAGELGAKVKPGGIAVLVVGNSTLKGNYIRNDVIARTAMEQAGFTLKDRRVRPIPASRRYMAIDTKAAESSLAKRMRDEVVLTMTRA